MEKTPKQEEIEIIEKFLVEELDRITKPKELLIQRDKSQMEKVNVIYNVYKLLANYDDIEPIMKQYYFDKAWREKFAKEEER